VSDICHNRFIMYRVGTPTWMYWINERLMFRYTHVLRRAIERYWKSRTFKSRGKYLDNKSIKKRICSAGGDAKHDSRSTCFPIVFFLLYPYWARRNCIDVWCQIKFFLRFNTCSNRLTDLIEHNKQTLEYSASSVVVVRMMFFYRFEKKMHTEIVFTLIFFLLMVGLRRGWYLPSGFHPIF